MTSEMGERLHLWECRIMSGTVRNQEELDIKRELFGRWALQAACAASFPFEQPTGSSHVFGIDGDRTPQRVRLVINEACRRIYFYNVEAPGTVRTAEDRRFPGRRTFVVGARTPVDRLRRDFHAALAVMSASIEDVEPRRSHRPWEL